MGQNSSISSGGSSGGPVRVMLWGIPRSLSTAFVKCFDTMENAEIFLEPFSSAYFFGPEKRCPTVEGLQTPEDPEYKYGWVKKQLEAEFQGKELIFCKDMGFAIDGRYDAIPDGYQHTFIIRKPVKALLSYHKVVNSYPHHTEEVSVKYGLSKGLAYKELYDLYEHICKTTGKKPIIIDADDLCQNPEAVLRRYCKAIGVKFSKSMLSWKQYDAVNPEWHCSPSFSMLNNAMKTYSRALQSKTFAADSTRPQIPENELPEGVRECVSEVQDYYNKMFEQRLKVPLK